MEVGGNNGERVMRFHALYTAVFKDQFDRAEFDADDLYAFQAFERALRSENQELRNLAAHLQAQRQAAIESITLTSTEALDRTRKLTILAAEPEVGSSPAASEPPSAPPPAPHAEPVPVSQPAEPVKPAAERRSGAARLSPQEIERAAKLQRLYRKEFGRTLDITQFALDDTYGRTVINEALAAQDEELVAIAKLFVDEHGNPRLHRRSSERTRRSD